MISFSNEAMAGFAARAQEKANRDIAATFRADHGPEVEHLSDDELLAAVTEARETAVGLGIEAPHLRMRFIRLAVFRLPDFYRDETIWQMLTGTTGTPDTRFGDVCALIKMSAERAGKQDLVWWDE